MVACGIAAGTRSPATATESTPGARFRDRPAGGLDGEPAKPRRLRRPAATARSVRSRRSSRALPGLAVRRGRVVCAGPGGRTGYTNAARSGCRAARHPSRRSRSHAYRCGENGFHHRAMRRRMKRLGIRPVADPDVAGIRRFRRSDIPPDWPPRDQHTVRACFPQPPAGRFTCVAPPSARPGSRRWTWLP